MAAFLRRFGWLLGAVVVLLMAALMIRLGIWQLDRLHGRRELNARVERALSAPPLALTGVVTDVESLEFRRAAVRGVFDHSREILLVGRTLQGRPGFHVVTPLRIEGGEAAVLVDRGWVSLERREAQTRKELQEPGIVEVEGIVRRSQQPTQSPLGSSDPPLQPGESRRETWVSLTIDRVQKQLPYPLLPLYIERDTAPPGGATPVPNPQIRLSEGPHLGYAIQWFSFAAIIAVGYATVYVKQRRRVAGDEAPALERG